MSVDANEPNRDANGVGAGTRTGLAWLLYGAVLAQFAAAILVWIIVHRRMPGAALHTTWREASMIGLPFATLGVVVARRRPEQQLGWLLGIGVVEGAMFATGEAAAAMFDLHGASVTVAATSWAYSVLNWIALGGLATVLVLFPTGRPASPWSRYVLWALGASVRSRSAGSTTAT